MSNEILDLGGNTSFFKQITINTHHADKFLVGDDLYCEPITKTYLAVVEPQYLPANTYNKLSGGSGYWSFHEDRDGTVWFLP